LIQSASYLVCFGKREKKRERKKGEKKKEKKSQRKKKERKKKKCEEKKERKKNKKIGTNFFRGKLETEFLYILLGSCFSLLSSLPL